jgi:hypothetical protein
MNMAPRWGFSSFGVGGYNHGAPSELRNGSSAAARITALMQRHWGIPLAAQIRLLTTQ